jgi:hypothetical protein
MATIYKFVSGDTSPQISVTLTREDGSAVDLTGATVYLHIRAKGSPDLTLTKTATISDAVNGAFIVVWAEGDLDLAAGAYDAEIEVVTDTYRETVYDLLQIQIRDDVA